MSEGHPTARSGASDSLVEHVDYISDINEVYEDLAFQCCKRSNSLEVLSCVQYQTEDDLQRPASWAASWHMKGSQLWINVAQTFDCCLTAETQQLYYVERLGTHLKVLGIPFDVVNNATGPIRWEELSISSSDEPSGFKNPLERCWRLTQGTSPMYEKKSDALKLVLVSGSYDGLERMDADFESYCRRYCTKELCDSSIFPEHVAHNYDSNLGSQRFLRNMSACAERIFFTTKRGLFGIGPRVLKPGDICSILAGSRVPLILRPSSEKGCYKLVGECYVGGVMWGEMVRKAQEERQTMGTCYFGLKFLDGRPFHLFTQNAWIAS